MLDYLRSHLTPDTREKLYMFAALIVGSLGTKAQLAEDTQTAILAVVVAGIAFVFAAVNSTTTLVATGYALIGSVAALGLIWAPEGAPGWVGWVGTGLAVVGQIVAALRTPTTA